MQLWVLWFDVPAVFIIHHNAWPVLCYPDNEIALNYLSITCWLQMLYKLSGRYLNTVKSNIFRRDQIWRF